MFKEFFEALIPQAPGLAAGVAMVFAFLWFLRDLAEKNKAEREKYMEVVTNQNKEFNATVQTVSASCHAVQKEATEKMTECINRNTEMLGRVGHALDNRN